MLSDLDVATIDADWLSEWGQALPSALRDEMLADERLAAKLFARTATICGVRRLDPTLPEAAARCFGVYMADPARACDLIGLALHARPLSQVIAGDDVRRLAEAFATADVARAISWRDRLPQPAVDDDLLPRHEDIRADAEAAVRLWLETLPNGLADRVMLTLPRRPGRPLGGWKTESAVALVEAVLMLAEETDR